MFKKFNAVKFGWSNILGVLPSCRVVSQHALVNYTFVGCFTDQREGRVVNWCWTVHNQRIIKKKSTKPYETISC